MNRAAALLSVSILTALASTAIATPTLVVTETPGDYYTITAQDSADPGIQFWEIRVDVQSGGIYSLKDLTDAGDGAGGHTSYLGASAYNRQCTLLYFDGRGGNVGTRRGALAGLADRLSFATAPDGSAFTITYTETAAAAGFFHSAYEDGAKSLAPGELLTTITVTIRPPSPDGTLWDWSIACENVSAHDLSPKIWAAELITTWIEDSVVRTADSEDSRSDGPYDEANPISYARWTISDNAAAGLTTGREFILDYQTGLSVCEAGGGITEDVWAGYGNLTYSSPFNYGVLPLAPGATQIHAGQFVINIAGSTPGAPTADAGPDQDLTAPTPDGITATLDGAGSTDLDGTIVSYVWTEDVTQIATGVNPQVDLAVGFHVIVLTVTDDVALTDTDTVVIDVGVAGADRLFFIDFDSGDDSAHGRSAAAAWKHCPGDANAIGIAAGTVLAGGDTVLFKGGVTYRGYIALNAGGEAGNPLIVDGNTAGTYGTGRAVIDGSEPLTGWTACTSPDDCGGNPNWAMVHYADLPPGTTIFTENMFEDDQLLTMAQGPDVVDPRYYDDTTTYRSVPETDVTNTSIIDAGFFTQADPNAWDGAYIHVWANPNQVFTKRVTGYSPGASQILFEAVSPGLYPDRPTLYAMTNSFLVLDQPGEYVIDETAGRVYLWPLSSGDPSGSEITVSVRLNGIDFRGNSYVTIQGFKVIKHSSPQGAAGNGCGIRNYLAATDLIVRDNEVAYQRSMEKYGGIYLSGVDNALITDNYVHDNVRNRGIMCGGADSVISDNLLETNGGTGIYMTGATNGLISGNTVLDHTGTHANGITLYQGCQDCTVIGNTVKRGGNALTTEVSDGLVIAYNVFSTDVYAYTVADWGDSTNLSYYNNTMVNNADYVGLMVSGSSQVGLTIRNNIIDAGGSAGPGTTHNLYISLAWSQTPGYGWYPSTGEIVELDKSLVFVDAANDDYRLIAGSPALDAGIDLGYSTDLLGAPVPDGAAPDMGAYEGAFSGAVPGDADGDGDVDLDDFVILKSNFGSSPLTDDRADFDFDGDIDLDDFVILKTNFGT